MHETTNELNDAELTILHDHYKDTFAYIREYAKYRGQLFFFILLVIAIMLFQLYSPKGAETALSEATAQQLGLSSPIDISFIGSLTWFVLLGILVRYFQTMALIEKQYTYIHNLEAQLSAIFKGNAFTREGKSYLSNYPLFSEWTHILYTIIFPILLLLIMTIKIVDEWQQSTSVSWILIFNSGIFLMIVISTALYFLLVHFKK